MHFALIKLQSGDTNQPKAAFFISTPFTDKVFSILQDIICVSNFRNVSVFSNIPPMMHSIIEYHSTEDETRAFDSYRMQILQWLEIKVRYFALCYFKIEQLYNVAL